MFTGIIENVGTVNSIQTTPGGSRMVLLSPGVARELNVGDSVAVNGACLTKVAGNDDIFEVDVSPETLKKTNLIALRKGDAVNLELSMRLGDRLGGHMVTGHIDAVGTLEKRRPEGDSEIVTVGAPDKVMRYIVEKGSVAIDGISLTVAARDESQFEVAIIPHTAIKTTLLTKTPGESVNLEVDLIGKYVERFLIDDSSVEESKLTKEFLIEQGYD